LNGSGLFAPPSSAKGTGARAIPTKAAVVGMIGKDTRRIGATDYDCHTIENVNGISGNNLCARSTQRHIGNELSLLLRVIHSHETQLGSS
jgi:hypothetical protein